MFPSLCEFAVEYFLIRFPHNFPRLNFFLILISTNYHIFLEHVATHVFLQFLIFQSPPFRFNIQSDSQITFKNTKFIYQSKISKRKNKNQEKC